MTQQEIYDKLLACWTFAPGLGKKSFDPRLLVALPRQYKIHCYTDTSITFSYAGHKYYGHYEWQSNSWVFDKTN